MAEHELLVEEMAEVSKLSIQERLILARSRRMEQLKCYERQWMVTAHAQQISNIPTNNSRRDPKNVKFDSKTRLFEAVRRNDADEVRSMLKSGQCHKDSTNEDGFTVLHQCCIDGHENLVRSLILDFGASVKQPDNELWTPLHTVALCGRSHIAKLLIDQGADLLALNIDSNMPYDICEDDETLDIIEFEMSRRGVTQDQIEQLRMTKEKQMLADLQPVSRESGDLEARGVYGETPLHVAAANGYTTVAKFLLDAKVTVDAEDDDLWQPIHCAAKWKQLPVLELLIINGADLTSMTSDGRTALDLCDDPELQSWMIELRQEIESKKSSSVTSHQRLLEIIASKNSIQMQQPTSGSSTIYSSNISLSDGSKTSSSNRRLTTSDKELLKKQSVQEETKIRLSLQSLVQEEATEIGPPSSRASPPNHHHQTTNSTQPLDRNGNIVTATGDQNPTTNGLVNGQPNTKPKSCLKRKPSSPSSSISKNPMANNKNSLNGTINRKRKTSAAECCRLS